MDQLYITVLLLFFAQGRIGGKHPLARGIAILIAGALAAAFSLCVLN